MLDYDFMRQAFAASGVVALTAGLVGYFLVLRGQSFAGHALSHVGFTGAAGALLVGLPPFGGLVLATLLAALAMGGLGERLAGRDVAIGTVLSAFLGLGLLFLHFFSGFAAEATALLFGNVLAVDSATGWWLCALSAVVLLGLAAILRPLLFATLQPELAQARGISLRGQSALFLALVALATAACAQVVGVLLVFSLMIAPAATAMRLTRNPGPGLLLSAVLALAQAWAGIAVAFWTDWPASACISLLGAAVFLSVLPLDGRVLRRAPRDDDGLLPAPVLARAALAPEPVPVAKRSGAPPSRSVLEHDVLS